MDLSPTARVILGMLRIEPLCGYEIKSLVDESTRFFWNAGYGSIYPELKRLATEGLIEGTPDPAGDRRRIVFRLTGAGQAALDQWLGSEPEPLEMRDEALLQTFFATGPEQASASLRTKAEGHARVAERLRELEAKAEEMASPYPLSTLRYGLDLHEYARRWCEREADRIDQGAHGTRAEKS